jgi:hypothetical protein
VGTEDDRTFSFRFDPRYRLLAAPFGVTPARSSVQLAAGRLQARFGPWRVETSLDNVIDAEPTGPYRLVKTIGPAHVSFTDRGLTFATNPDRGACIRFHSPVRGMDPAGVVRHPGLTVTVADVDGLLAALSRR